MNKITWEEIIDESKVRGSEGIKKEFKLEDMFTVVYEPEYSLKRIRELEEQGLQDDKEYEYTLKILEACGIKYK